MFHMSSDLHPLAKSRNNRILPVNFLQNSEESVLNNENQIWDQQSFLQKKKEKVLLKYSKNKPTLNWDANNKKGVYYSGWNPLCGINICFQEDSDNDMMRIIIEINTLCSSYICHDTKNRIVAFEYLFKKDSETKKINMTFRMKPFKENEHIVVYKDCKYFGLDYDYDEIIKYNPFLLANITKTKVQSRFTISNDWQDKTLSTGVNFLHHQFKDFKYVTEYINEFIQNHIVREHLIPENIKAYPLLNIVQSNPEHHNPLHERHFPIANEALVLPHICIDVSDFPISSLLHGGNGGHGGHSVHGEISNAPVALHIPHIV